MKTTDLQNEIKVLKNSLSTARKRCRRLEEENRKQKMIHGQLKILYEIEEKMYKEYECKNKSLKRESEGRLNLIRKLEMTIAARVMDTELLQVMVESKHNKVVHLRSCNAALNLIIDTFKKKQRRRTILVTAINLITTATVLTILFYFL